MSAEQVESAILALPEEERRRLVDWLDDHRHELIPILAAQEREVRRRLAEAEANPAILEPFEEADFDRMIKEFADARAQKAPARKN